MPPFKRCKLFFNVLNLDAFVICFSQQNISDIVWVLSLHLKDFVSSFSLSWNPATSMEKSLHSPSGEGKTMWNRDKLLQPRPQTHERSKDQHSQPSRWQWTHQWVCETIGITDFFFILYFIPITSCKDCWCDCNRIRGFIITPRWGIVNIRTLSLFYMEQSTNDFMYIKKSWILLGGSMKLLTVVAWKLKYMERSG